MQPKYKNKLESKFATTYNLPYETHKFKYVIEHTYTPDWVITDNIFMETKGRWESSDRTKIAQVLKQNPTIQVIMIFQNPNAKLSKTSSTTYAQWCDKHNVKWFDIKNTTAIQKYITFNQNQMRPCPK